MFLKVVRTRIFFYFYLMENTDLRWRQRFVGFEKAYVGLKEAMDQDQLNELERSGLIQRFKFSIDLAWKIMKDFLENQGFQFKPSPKETFRQAFESGYIGDAQPLIDGLEVRNTLSHDYSGEKFESSEKTIRNQVYPALTSLYHFFQNELTNHGR